VTTTGDGEFIIHTAAEKDFIPIVLHHYPICVTYALFGDGKIPVADPTVLEERVSDASLVLAINSYKELCCMHLTGVSLTSPSLILKCSEMAAERSRRIVEFIKSTLEEDESERAKGNLPKGFAESIKLSSVPSNYLDEKEILQNDESEASAMEDESNEDEEVKPVNKLNSKTVASVELEESEESSSDDQEMEVKPAVAPSKKLAKMEVSNQGDSSEEDETVVLK
jgi:exosome complex component RRP45